MNKALINKPSLHHFYILKFPSYTVVWQLKYKQDGFLHFCTSTGKAVAKMNLARFQYLCNHYLIKIIRQSEPKAKEKVTRTTKTSPFKSREYTKEELDTLIDNIDDIVW